MAEVFYQNCRLFWNAGLTMLFLINPLSCPEYNQLDRSFYSASDLEKLTDVKELHL